MDWSLVCVTLNDNRNGLQQQETQQKATGVNGQEELGVKKWRRRFKMYKAFTCLAVANMSAVT